MRIIMYVCIPFENPHKRDVEYAEWRNIAQSLHTYERAVWHTVARDIML